MPGSNLTKLEAQERKSVVLSPITYDVHLDIASNPEVFASSTRIEFNAVPGTSTFLDLTARSVECVVLNGQELDLSDVYEDNRIALHNLQEHNVVRVVAFCEYSHTGEGLHRSVDPADGNVYLYTQFEVPDARRVYAVFDQPDLKAVFTFSVNAPSSWIVTSNMPVASRKRTKQTIGRGVLSDGVAGSGDSVAGSGADIAGAADVSAAGEDLAQAHATGAATAEGVDVWTFEPTPIMSSYLTAICAGPYADWHTEYNNEDGRVVPMAVYCRQALKDAFAKDVDYLFDIVKKGFAFYAKTWGVPYPYAKYDQIYVPEYNAGAMENIGMVTIRDQYIFSSKVSDALAERRVVTVLHELAHMWFGDYVTMKWWNDLWLNESFAEFTSTLATAEATDWTEAWATFTSGEKSWALAQDQLLSTHPIVAPINDLHDTYVNFDGITYAKGASVLKQMVAYVGREAFFEGIGQYLNKHAYSNATLDDLLQELSATSGRDMSQWSKLWLEQANINTLTAHVDVDDDGVITACSIEQTAPESHPVVRPHRLAIGFYNDNGEGRVVRTDRFEVDIDGEATQIPQLVGKPMPAMVLINDDDLTYAKLRFDERSLAFAVANLDRFEDALARAIIWLSLWDMTRDGELPAQTFIETALKALRTEKQSTTMRYALRQIQTVAQYYVDPAERHATLEHVAHELWTLSHELEPGSDSQFQFVTAYLSYGQPGDEEFVSHVRGLLEGDVVLDDLEIDNNMRWSLIQALAHTNELDEAQIDEYLAQNDTTENREFAYGAKAARSTLEAKDWAFEQAIRNTSLTNSQMQYVGFGFQKAHEELATRYAQRYFDEVLWIWKNRSFHMAQSLLELLFPLSADPELLSSLGHQWLDDHADADNALQRILIEIIETADRILKVRAYNVSLHEGQ